MMGETDNRKKKKYSSFGQTVCGIGGMFIMIYLVDPDWGGGVLEAGLECGLGWASGAGVYLIFHYVFLGRHNTDEIKHEQKQKENRDTQRQSLKW